MAMNDTPPGKAPTSSARPASYRDQALERIRGRQRQGTGGEAEAPLTAPVAPEAVGAAQGAQPAPAVPEAPVPGAAQGAEAVRAAPEPPSAPPSAPPPSERAASVTRLPERRGMGQFSRGVRSLAGVVASIRPGPAPGAAQLEPAPEVLFAAPAAAPEAVTEAERVTETAPQEAQAPAGAPFGLPDLEDADPQERRHRPFPP